MLLATAADLEALAARCAPKALQKDMGSLTEVTADRHNALRGRADMADAKARKQAEQIAAMEQRIEILTGTLARLEFTLKAMQMAEAIAEKKVARLRKAP